MRQSSLRLFLIRGIICGVLHFGAMLLIGVLLFYRHGFAHPPIRDFYEASLGAGIVYAGLPDTVVGWGINSILYGLATAVVITVLRYIRHQDSQGADPLGATANRPTTIVQLAPR